MPRWHQWAGEAEPRRRIEAAGISRPEPPEAMEEEEEERTGEVKLQQEGQDTPPNLLKAVVTDITLMATRLGTVWHPYPVPGSTRSWPSDGQTSLAQKRIN